MSVGQACSLKLVSPSAPTVRWELTLQESETKLVRNAQQALWLLLLPRKEFKIVEVSNLYLLLSKWLNLKFNKIAHAGYLVIFTERGKNNYYHGRKVSNCTSLHKENVLAINTSGLLCRRRGATKMLIELDLNVRWSSEVVMMTSSVANETVKHYRVTINKAEGFRLGNHFTRRNLKLRVL